MSSRRHHEASRRFESAIAPPAGLYADIHASIRAMPAQRIETRTRITLALAAACCLVPAAVAIASQLVYRRQAVGLAVGVESNAHLLVALAVLVALTLAATFVALRRSGRASEITSLLLAASLVAPVYAAVTLIHPVHAADPFPPPVELSAWGARCIVVATLTGAITLVSFTAALRRAVPAGSGFRGAALGAAAGAWAGLAVFVFCPAEQYLHLLVGHLLPVVALTIAGTIGIPRALRP